MTYAYNRTSLVSQTVKNLPVMRETWVRSLGREDPLEKEMAMHSNILAWRIPWTEEPGGPQSMGLKRVGPGYATNTHMLRICFSRQDLEIVSARYVKTLII